ncbi:hypothetical protein [Moorena sp. SIO3H5]|uniref:hypothetical protein n=1 Tax=Moorena sp. SIO3H5 TaxID=2607834 RepID=UPI0013B7396A|nr:hypothetical protein [Moorena sp. SIO3H5]NEO73178.1 hypothetical protein [Moorena sp. SIO3H5]
MYRSSLGLFDQVIAMMACLLLTTACALAWPGIEKASANSLFCVVVPVTEDYSDCTSVLEPGNGDTSEFLLFRTENPEKELEIEVYNYDEYEYGLLSLSEKEGCEDGDNGNIDYYLSRAGLDDTYDNIYLPDGVYYLSNCGYTKLWATIHAKSYKGQELHPPK